jgi:hypothetical protein
LHEDFGLKNKPPPVSGTMVDSVSTHCTFYSVRTLICQQSPKLALSGSNMGLMLTASANLITKVPLMLKTLSTIVPETSGEFLYC